MPLPIERSQGNVASLVSRFQNAADRDAGAAARDPTRRVSAGAGVAGVIPATRRPSGMGWGGNGGGEAGDGGSSSVPVASLATAVAAAAAAATAAAAGTSPSPAAAKEAKALAPVAPNLPSPTPELVPDTELKKEAVKDSSSSPDLGESPAADNKQLQQQLQPKKATVATAPGTARRGRVSKSPVRKGAVAATTTTTPRPAQQKKETPAAAKPTASPSSQPVKLKPSNTGLSSASRHSGRELEVRPQTTGGSRSSPGKNTATTAASNKSTSSPGDKDKVKQRPRSSLGVTGAGATVTRTPVRSSASATSSKQPPRSSLSAASAGKGSASPTPVATATATPRAHSPSSVSRLLQGTAASRARAAATASNSVASARTSPTKPRTSPNKDVAALKASRTGPRGSLASTNATATPVRRSPLTSDVRKRPPIGRVGLAAAREAPKSTPTARAKNGVAKVKGAVPAAGAIEASAVVPAAGKGSSSEQDGERVLVDSPVEDKHNDDADDEHDEHELDDPEDEEVLDDYDADDDERFRAHVHHDYYHHHEREPSYINDHTDTSTVGVSDSVSQRMGSPESVPSIPDE